MIAGYLQLTSMGVKISDQLDKSFSKNNLFWENELWTYSSRNVSTLCIGVRTGEGGREGLQPSPQATEITWFFVHTAHDSGIDTWENTLQNNAVGVISKTRK